MLNQGLFTSNKNNWCTPIDFFINLDQEFHFDYDLCASDNNHLCKKYFTRENSCLNANLTGFNIFCNPPYGRDISKYIKKCYDLSSNNLVVMLLPARTDTRWFHDYIYNKSEIRFIKGRLKFSNSKQSAPFPSMVVIYRREYNENFKK